MDYLKAIKKIGTDEPLKVAEQMRAMPVEDFFPVTADCVATA